MKKKSTIKYKKNSLPNYQFGGLNLPFLDQYTNLNKQWGDFWKGGDYFKQRDPLTIGFGDGSTMLDTTVKRNQGALDLYTDTQTRANNNYKGEWGDDAHNFYYRQDWDSRNPNATQADKDRFDQYASFEKINGGLNANDMYGALGAAGINPGDYSSWEKARNRDASKFGAAYDKSRDIFNKDLPMAKKQMGQAMTNSAAGIFSGLNYLNAYKAPEAINMEEGFQGVQIAQKGATVKDNKMLPISNLGRSNRDIQKRKALQALKDNTATEYTGELIDNLIGLHPVGGVLTSAAMLGEGAPLSEAALNVIPFFKLAKMAKTKKGIGQAYLNLMGAGAEASGFNPKEPIEYEDPTRDPVGSWQHGGTMNTTGYTPGTPTANNKINIIPGGNITMETTPQMKSPLLGIVNGGAKHGLIQKLEPGKNYNYIGAKSVAELPLMGKEESTSMAQYGGMAGALQSLGNQGFMPNGLSEGQANYLNQISGGNGSYAMADPALNMRMLAGYKPQEAQTQAVYQGATNQIAQPTNINPMSISESTKQNLLNNKGHVFSIKGDRTYEYSKDANGNWLTRKKGSKTNWINIQDNADAVTKLNAEAQLGNVNSIKTKSGNIRKSNTSSIQASNTSYINDNVFRANATSIIPQQQSLSWDPTNPLAEYAVNPNQFNIAKPGLNSLVGSIAPKANLQNLYLNNRPQGVYAPANNYQYKNIDYNNTDGSTKSSIENLILNDYVQLAAIEKGINYNNADGATKNALKSYAEDLLLKEAMPGMGKIKLSSKARKGNLKDIYNKKHRSLINKQYGGTIPKFQFGGVINNDHSFPVHPITEEFTEIQAEVGENVLLTDGTIVNVKATKLHKDVDKNFISDILPPGAEVFSNDPKMKLSLDTKIGGVRIGDMTLGKTVFEYKENEITTGPKDIMLSDIWGKKEELTPAELVNNIKNKFEVRDQKDDFFVQRANQENKEQRLRYLEIVKAFSEFKKPKSKRQTIPQAQYGMKMPSINSGISSIYNQPYNNAIDGVMGYNNKALDPMGNMDNAMKSMYNVSSVTSPKLFQDGGHIPHAQLGELIRYATPIGWVGGYFANKAKKKQEKQNALDEARYNNITDQYTEGVQQTGMLSNVGALAGYAASLNVPDLKYNDYSANIATLNDSYGRQNAMLDAQKYAAINNTGGAGSLARLAGNNQNLGGYLAAMQAQSNNASNDITGQQLALESDRARTLSDLRSRGLDNRYAVDNNKSTHLYNAHIGGIQNTFGSLTSAYANNNSAKYEGDINKMTYQEFLRNKAQAKYDEVNNRVIRIGDSIGQIGLMAATGGLSALTGGNKQNQQGQPSNDNPYGFNGTSGYDMSNYTSNPYGFNGVSGDPRYGGQSNTPYFQDPFQSNSFNPESAINFGDALGLFQMLGIRYR